MKLGFIGTGKIASSVIIGICNSKIKYKQIIISPRNRKIANSLKKNIWPLIEKKKIKPILCKTFPLERVKDAHIYMDKGLHFGKIALTF